MSAIKLSVVIPCFNEAPNLQPLLEGWARLLERDDIELIIVENGSTDESAALLRTLLPQYPFARCLSIAVNRGYGHGLKAGLATARGQYLSWTHGDLQTDGRDVLAALSWVEARGDPERIYVKGTRLGRAFTDRVFSMAMGLLATLLLGHVLSDINAEPNLFHRSFFTRWESPPDDYMIELYALHRARRLDLRIHRIPVAFPARRAGRSSWNSGLWARVLLGLKTLRFLLRLRAG